VNSVVVHQPFRIAAILLIFVAVGAVLACQFHVTTSGHEHATSNQHQSVPSAHAMLDVSCLAAVLPTMLVFAALICFLFYAAPMLLKHTAPASALFKPPKMSLC
jgi:hypothetical protein